VACSQIWLNLLVDDHQCGLGYNTKLEKQKKPNKTKQKQKPKPKNQPWLYEQ
jgi:hypothetical protein